MPVHDWTLVSAGTFHDFHMSWITHIKEALNEGILPKGYYAQAEQSVPGMRPDVLALSNFSSTSLPDANGGVATMTRPSTRLSRRADANVQYRLARRTIAIRHVSGHQVVALIEIASPANKDRVSSVEDFVEKLWRAVQSRIHVLLVDLFPPGPYDPRGLHGEFWGRYDLDSKNEPLAGPLCLASYEAVELPEAWIEPITVGDELPEMPLFYDRGRYIQVPLAATYERAWRGVPEFWRDVVEGRASA